ncbi:MAG: T9SS type A sorting domain-containing protein [Bacteroidetes bacterium]|nr:T9SS type A sorting domain-containing protein [Bacteroidota bacterium]MBL7104122.1 T9SS type A sorting domain-containing protein [Bacteroidales bacterium]
MKRTLSLLSLLIIGTNVLQAQSATFELPQIPNPGSTVTVPLSVIDCNGDCCWLSTAQFIIIYNSGVLTPTGNYNCPNPNYPFYEWMITFYSENTIVITYLSFSGSIQMNPPEVLIELVFNYNSGTSVLNLFGNMNLGNSNCDLIFINGCVGGTSIGDNIWTGNISDNWFEYGNWSFSTVPTEEDDILIPGITNIAYPVIDNASIIAKKITIMNNGIITLSPSASLTINELFINDGLLQIQSDNMGHSGSFINLGGIDGTGTFEFDRHITNSSPSTDPFDWHYLSSPIQGFYSDNIPDYLINNWDEFNGMYQVIQGNIPCTPADPPVVLNPMEGWSIKLDPDYISNCGFGTGETIEITGQTTDLHSGTYSVPFTFTPGNTFEGWNLLGNPYPCSIDPGLISWPENLNQSIYLWDGRLSTYFTWAGGVGPNIPPTQGFFVNAIGNGTMTFSGDERIHDTELPWFKSEIEDLVTLKATATGNDYYDITHIRFLNEATPQFDKVWDAYKLLSTVPEVPQIYTSAVNDILSINTQPETLFVPLAFTSGQSGIFTIEAIETSEFTDIRLEDIFTGTLTDLLIDSYTFDYTAGDDPDRFIIHFTPVGFYEYEASNIKKIWSNDHNIYINIPNGLEGSIVVYNLIGQEIIRTNIKAGLNIIPTKVINTFYIVKVLTNSYIVTEKVYIK